jgi:GDPmannose 4,6-dehydratase
MIRKALVWGVSGQAGSFASEFLLEQGYKVVGVIRRNSTYSGLDRLVNCIDNQKFSLVEGDITDAISVSRITKQVEPDVIFSYACQSHVATSFEQPEYTFKTIVDGTLNILETIRDFDKSIRFVTCSSSEMFGSSVDQDGYQRETTPFRPNSPYAAAKLAAHNLVSIYRKSYGLHASCAIPFNYESSRRGIQFVTQKIITAIANGRPVELGNIHAKRDWSDARDIIRAIYLMSLADQPDDYVICSGKTRTVEDFLFHVLQLAEIPKSEWNDWYSIHPKLFRPCEVPYLCGDCSKIKRILKWEPQISFESLVQDMWESAIADVRWETVS